MAKGPERGNRRDLSEAEADLWQRVTADAKRLNCRDRADSEPSQQPTATDTLPPRRTPATGVRRVPPSSAAPALPELDHGTAPGLDKRTLDRLRRGRIPIDSRLDLHGFTQEEAHRMLGDFLASAQSGGRRCVLVITGKGSRGDRGTGVLKSAVPAWLNQPPNRARVLGFCHAIPPHGGEGALYILLRRLR